VVYFIFMLGDFCTFIHENCEFKGTMSFEGTTRIDGKIKGEIHSHELLIIGPTGQVDGNIHVGALVIYGKLKGKVFAKHRVEAKGNAVVQADIHAPIIQLEEGVQFEGRTVMNASQSAS
jgi:cytoskeletal protein CcmA (bactofilin family)